MDLGALRVEADQAYAVVAAPGPAVGRSLAEWVELLAEVQEAVNVLQAVQTIALAQVAAIEDVILSDGTVGEQHRGLGHQRIDGPGLVADRLGLSEQAAAQRMSCAVSMVTRTPALVSAMASGALDGFRAGVVCDELDDAPADVAAEVVDRLAEHLGCESAGPLRRRTRRILGSVAPAVLARRAASTQERRGLHRSVEVLGLDEWRGWYPVEQSRSAWAAVDTVAQGYLREGRAQTIDQARADAHMDLLLAQVTATIHLHTTVPAASVAATHAGEAVGSSHPSDSPLVEVGGLGATGTSYVSRSWLTDGTTVTSTPMVCHPETGAVQADSASTAYRPPASMQALVRLRDGHCRFPGCAVSARFCDLDHVVGWPAGPTTPDNLMCLCRRHHRVKQRPRWSVRIDPDGTVIWRDPTGRTIATPPIDHLHLVPDGRPVESMLPTDDQAPLGAAPSSGADEWSLLDDILLRRLLDAGVKDPVRRRRPTDPSRRPDLCFAGGLSIGYELPDELRDEPPF